MEALLFFLNSAVVVALAIMSLIDDRRRPGTPQVGLFRYIEDNADQASRDREAERIDRIKRSYIR